MRVFSDLDLNGPTSTRVQPKVGTWGPGDVPSTRRKKWVRALAVVAFVVALAGLVGFASWVYFQFMKG